MQSSRITLIVKRGEFESLLLFSVGISAGASDHGRSITPPRASSLSGRSSGILRRALTSQPYPAASQKRISPVSTPSASLKRNRVRFGQTTYASDYAATPTYSRARSDAGAGFPIASSKLAMAGTSSMPIFKEVVTQANPNQEHEVEYATDSSSDDDLEPISRGISLTSTVSTESNFSTSSAACSSDEESVPSPAIQHTSPHESGHRFSFDHVDTSSLNASVCKTLDVGVLAEESTMLQRAPFVESTSKELSSKSSTSSLLSPTTLLSRTSASDSNDFYMGTPRLEWVYTTLILCMGAGGCSHQVLGLP